MRFRAAVPEQTGGLLGVCVEGRDAEAAAALVERRGSLENPFCGGE